MTERADKRREARLNLCYPIRVTGEGSPPPGFRPGSRTVTRNLGARGAYFSTEEGAAYRLGQEVAIVLSVPHRLAAGGEEVTLDLRGRGRVVRIDSPDSRIRGEDGVARCGVAVAFEGPLTFNYRWV